MAKKKPRQLKKPSQVLINSVSEETMEMLQDIDRMHVCNYADDAAGAVRDGAILLAISRVDNDDDGDGFRYLIGLREGTQVTPSLSNFF